ncbi:MAG: hypothetical protein KBA75_10705 [Alphaproteobacteria bacterium]|nr:hypothetical protein [Alphaproteobacteria bacterium]
MEVRIDGVKYVPVPDAPTNKGLLDALEVRFDSGAGDDITVRDYLRTLLITLWEEKESFSGKRPFGNSGWEYEVLIPLAKAGFVYLGPLNEDGEPYNWTQEQIQYANAYVSDLILAAFHGVHEG